ncbi:NB-ARC domain-containing protein [Colletotrichum musicola]|uniref:NB-ARC domain-containing protein n=1 Tax=Colletotrichum musicola TaxID=2175873 RepID=A0A8H6IRD3_9PEZI|nr:NB-ARC domain-containing protein [Colletotrichum musicola]
MRSIIAVHGLNPRSKNDTDHTWDTWRTPSGPDGRLWLRDDLPKHVPDSRIFLYQYNATAVYGKDRSTFIDKANDLLEDIRLEREDTESRPILFLGHSMGGLLIKQALINAHNNPNYTPIKDATRGLAFFTTPHHSGDWKLIVPRESARLGMPGDRENVVRLDADHSTVYKFGGVISDQDNLKRIQNNIKDIYKKALKNTILHGLGGIGKTQLATAYIKQHRADYPATIWINAKDVTSLKQSKTLSESAGSKAYDIRPYLPDADHGAVIMTTRSATVKLGQLIPLRKLGDVNNNLAILTSASNRTNLIEGQLYSNQGRLKEAEAMYERALQGKEKALGPDHTSTLSTVNNLGNLYKDQDRLKEAEAMYERALQGYEKAFQGKSRFRCLAWLLIIA